MNLLPSISLLVTLSVIWANLAFVSAQDAEGIYMVGTGKADITGPVAGVVLVWLKLKCFHINICNIFNQLTTNL